MKKDLFSLCTTEPKLWYEDSYGLRSLIRHDDTVLISKQHDDIEPSDLRIKNEQGDMGLLLKSTCDIIDDMGF